MMSLNEIIKLIGDLFFDGSSDTAGIAVYILVILGVLGLTQEAFYGLIAGMAVTLFFTTLGILSTDIAILLIVVSVLGLAYTSRSIWGR